MENHPKSRTFAGTMLHVGPMSESIWINLLTASARLALGVLRIFIFAKLLSLAEMGVWGTAAMGMTIFAPLLCLGMNQGLERYASVYETAGRLAWFFRRGFLGAVVVTIILGIVAACFLPVLRNVFFPESLGYSEFRSNLLTWLILINTVALGAYFVMLGLAAGLRMFRLVAFLELLFAALTTFAAAGAIYFYHSATAVLVVHLASVLACFMLGGAMLAGGMRRVQAADFSDVRPDDFSPADDLRALLMQLGRFGFVGLIAATAWQIVTFVSYYLTYITTGKDAAGEFTVILRIAQPVYTLALAMWAVIYTHTAGAWQRGERQLAIERMDVMFRRVSMMVMLSGWAIILSEPIWTQVLGQKYSGAGANLPGLMLMFAAMSNVLCLMTWGRILGRQWSAITAALAAGALNVAAYYGLRRMGTVEFSSLSAGLGVFAGSVLITVFYFARWKIKISLRCAVALLLPAIFLISDSVTTSLCAAAITVTTCYFSFNPSERKNLLGKNSHP